MNNRFEEKLNAYLSNPTSVDPALLKPFKDLFKVDIADEATRLWYSGIRAHQSRFLAGLQRSCHQFEGSGDIADILPGGE